MSITKSVGQARVAKGRRIIIIKMGKSMRRLETN